MRNLTVAPRHARADRAHVLIVEGGDDQREMYGELFRAGGWRVSQARTPATAWRLLRQRVPDVIITGLGRNLDGAELIRRVRAIPASAGVPIIVVSAHVYERHRRLAYDAGCTVFLPKPCLPTKLVAVATRLTRRHDAGLRGEDDGPDVQGPRGVIAPRLRADVGGDGTRNARRFAPRAAVRC